MDLVSIPIDDSDSFLIEVDSRRIRVGRGEEPIANAVESFQKSLHRVRQIAESVMTSVTDLAHRPDKVRVEFGVKLTGEANVIVTRAGGEAHFLLQLEWDRRTPGEGADDTRVS